MSEDRKGTLTITLRDVARLAGVGDSTASRVLRGSGSASVGARARVEAAAAELGYVLNPMAGALASARSRVVGVIVPSLGNSVFTDVLRGVDRALELTRHQALVGVTEYDPNREERLVASLLAWRPAAILLAGLEHTSGTRRLLTQTQTRVVELLDTDAEGIDVVVGFSNRAAGRASADYLFARGYRRFGYIGHDLASDLRAGKRHAAFVGRISELGLAPVETEIVREPSSVALGRQALSALLGRTPDLDAVYSSNDDVAMGGYFHCASAGIDVPGRLALFGYNGLDLGQAAPRPLSTLRTPRVLIGETAARLALAATPERRVVVPFELVNGQTS